MLSTITLFRFLFILALLPFATVACRPKPQVKAPTSELDAVDVDQTGVRNQFRVGFCWAYAALGLIESKHLMTEGKTIDLSEEAVGFYRMAEELVRIGQAHKRGQLSVTQAVAKATEPGKMEGWYVRAHNGSRDAMELIDSYGLVPEDNWSFKFRSASDLTSLRTAIGPAFRQLLESGNAVTVESMAKVLTATGGFPSVPPKTIRYEGQTMTSLEFARNVMKFKSSDYVSLSVRSGTSPETLVAAMKRSLARGISVPLSVLFDFEHLENDVLRKPGSGETLNPQAGGHAVLVSDFVNDGGREGAISSDELKVEVEKELSELKYLKFKNSWGRTARENEAGIPVTSNSEGYFYMDRGYLEAAAERNHLSIVVPSDIAANPYGQVVINPNVTTDGM